jgi:hypothetical protein
MKLQLTCKYCSKVFETRDSDIKENSKYHFCSRSCRATFYNKEGLCRKSIQLNPLKKILCQDCDISFDIKKNSPNKSRCKDCKKIRKNKLRKENQSNKNCLICFSTFISFGHRKCCSSECVKISLQRNGLKSVENQLKNKRSKNEILFGDKLKLILLNEEMLFNVPYFMDSKGLLWDADIILPLRKVAIHWNGPWHYKQISKSKHCSLPAIQNRDKLKYSIIENYRFINYIIRDDGKFSVKKVTEEFEKFILFLNQSKENIITNI